MIANILAAFFVLACWIAVAVFFWGNWRDPE